jgi:hypothetical protein
MNAPCPDPEHSPSETAAESPEPTESPADNPTPARGTRVVVLDGPVEGQEITLPENCWAFDVGGTTYSVGLVVLPAIPGALTILIATTQPVPPDRSQMEKHVLSDYAKAAIHHG